MTDADVAVVGLGAMGSMATWQLAQAGADVVGFEQYGLAHDRGAIGGESRLFRMAYHEGAEYVPLLRRARELWGELAEATGRPLFAPTRRALARAPRPAADGQRPCLGRRARARRTRSSTASASPPGTRSTAWRTARSVSSTPAAACCARRSRCSAPCSRRVPTAPASTTGRRSARSRPRTTSVAVITDEGVTRVRRVVVTAGPGPPTSCPPRRSRSGRSCSPGSSPTVWRTTSPTASPPSSVTPTTPRLRRPGAGRRVGQGRGRRRLGRHREPARPHPRPRRAGAAPDLRRGRAPAARPPPRPDALRGVDGGLHAGPHRARRPAAARALRSSCSAASPATASRWRRSSGRSPATSPSTAARPSTWRAWTRPASAERLRQEQRRVAELVPQVALAHRGVVGAARPARPGDGLEQRAGGSPRARAGR